MANFTIKYGYTIVVLALGALILASCDSSGTASQSDPDETDPSEGTDTYELSVSASPPDGGEVSDGGEYDQGSEVEISATPSSGWHFDGWTGDISSSANPDTVTITEDTEVSASFSRSEFDLEVSTEGEGEVTEEVVQEASTNATYDSTTVIELTANPSEGWEFSEWSGDISSTDNPVQVTMTEDKAVTAIFSEIPVTGVEVNPATASIYIDSTVALEASVIPEDANSQAVTWTSSDASIATVSNNGLVTGQSKGEADIIVSTEEGNYTASTSITVEKYFKDVGVKYKATDDLSVTLNSLNVTDKGSYVKYYISYTLENNTDNIIEEGSFKAYFSNQSGGEPQYGAFGDVTPGESVSRSYTWELEKENTVNVIEYHEDNFFRDEPYSESLKWKVEIPND